MTRNSFDNKTKRRRTKRRFGFMESLETRILLDGSPIITEFVAANDTSLTDGFGNNSDWLEIANVGDQAVDLGEYYLTDETSELQKWQFPTSTILEPGQLIVVFASGENQPDPDGNLHTNFRLASTGEYLALTSADGMVVSEFGSEESDYPKQFTDIAYGLGQISRSDQLIGSNAQLQYLVPSSEALGAAWNSVDFSPDENWQDGLNGIGYDTANENGIPVDNGVSILRLDFNDDDSGETGAADSEDGWQSFHLSDNGAEFDGIKVTVEDIGGIPLDDRDRTAPVDDPPSLTYDQIFDDFIFARSQTNGTGMEVLIEGLLPNRDYEITLWSFDVGSISSRVSNWSETSGPEPVSIESNYTFNGNNQPNSDVDNSMAALLTTDDHGTLRIQGVRNGGTSFGVFLNALQIVVPTVSELIQTDIGDDMFSKQSSVFTRFPFVVDAEISFTQSHLKLQYDAGFIAYLNGQEVARRNVPGVAGVPLAFDAIANSERSLDATVQPETIDISAFASLIQPGENVLAVHGINTSRGDDDFVLHTELVGTAVDTGAKVYFTTPSPGHVNPDQGLRGFVGDTAFSADRGFYVDDFIVGISSPTPGASIVYTTDGSLPTETNGIVVSAPDANSPPFVQIPISTTSFVRAFAFKEGYLPTNVDTQTYVFLDDVLQQDPRANPNGLDYPARWQANAAGDYEMDPDVVAQWDDNNPANTDFGIRDALMSIPTMSIVMDHEDLWDARRGVYPNATASGESWRRAGSVEYFDPRTGEEFQVDAGIQMHGGASRDNGRLKKHSFRLLFREDFGESQLNFPLYSDTDNEQFNTLVLRAFFTDAFATRTITDRYNPIESQYLRDVWMKDSQLAMGNLSAHNTYVHLYINGLYWGLYNPSERPDDAFLKAYLGGEREDWDIVKDFNELFRGSRSAWNDMFTLARRLPQEGDAAYHRLQGNNPNGTPNDELPNLLDMDNLIDFMILHIYAAVEDWPHHNWYAGRNRVDPGKGFKFFVWDQEIALDPRFRDRTRVADRSTPAELYSLLYRNSPEFRLYFADRIQKHFFNDGALTNEANQARWMTRANEIEKAIIGESARWGDAREGERHVIQSGTPRVTVPVMTVDLWRDERDKVHDQYIPQLRDLMMERFADIDLVSPVTAPEFHQHGGTVPSGFDLSISARQTPLLVETAIVPEFSPVTVLVPRDDSLDAPDNNTSPEWTLVEFDDSNWIQGVGGVGFEKRSGYESLLGVDLFDENLPASQSIDANGDGNADNPSVFTRFAFDLPADFDAGSFEQMFLKAKYDDGFAAYLNGTLIETENTPGTLSWDARASASNEAQVGSFEYFDVSEHLELLTPRDTNVLAIQALNRSAASSDFVISPELVLGALVEVEQAHVYVTLDGSDPRLPTGEIHNTAILTDAVTLTQTGTVRARALVEGIWSALTEATFIVNPAGTSDLAITEVNFNPYEPTDEELAAIPSLKNDDFEFVEFRNTSSDRTISLLGMEIVNGIQFAFPDVSLKPGEFGVVVANQQAFPLRYGSDVPVLGQSTGRLANSGESIAVVDAQQAILFDFGYSDDALWPQSADGIGATLELIDPAGTTTDLYGKYYSWRGSFEYGGSPGSQGLDTPGIVINEVLSRTEPPLLDLDSIELFNNSNRSIDIGGWHLSDSRQQLLKFAIPDGTTLSAGDYVVFDESHFNPLPENPAENHFALDGNGGDDVWLVIPDASNGVAAFVDDVHFGAAINGESFGRTPNGMGRLAPQLTQTLGDINTAPRVGPMIISEINYHPAPPSAAAFAIDANLTEGDLEFIEIHNPLEVAVELNGWRLRGGIDFDFNGANLGAGASLLLVPFNPDSPQNTNRTAAFREHYNIGENVGLIGGYGGQLSNNGERIQLQRLESSLNEPETRTYLLEDEVIFDDQSPWPLEADGTGSSLGRTRTNSFGNDGLSWIAADPSPGFAVFEGANADLNRDGQINIVDLNLLCRGIHTEQSRFDLNADGSNDRNDVDFMITDVLMTVIADVNLDGRFSSTDLVAIFQVGEYEDAIADNSRWSEGDWNCDGDFTTSDLVVAFQAGVYSQAALGVAADIGASVQALNQEMQPDSELPWRFPMRADQVAMAFQDMALEKTLEAEANGLYIPSKSGKGDRLPKQENRQFTTTDFWHSDGFDEYE